MTLTASVVLAQNIPSAGAGAKGAASKEPAAALRSLESGVKAYEAGRLEPAVQSLSHALSGGGLASQHMARALYYRGLAYRKQGKPAQAISDLTSAIWLKGGLLETERANAIENRAMAYREAGLGEPPPVGNAGARTASASSSGSGASPSAPAASAKPAPSANSVEVSSTSGSSSGGIGSFFSGLFGGASSGSSSESTTTASTGPAAATSSWSEATTVAVGSARAASGASKAPDAGSSVVAVPKIAASPAKAQPKGKFRLQVAAVRTRAEAEALAKKLKDGHAEAIGARETAIEQSVIGAMGTFYRVRVGPYADASEPRQLCSRIKSDGFDCLVVTK